MQNKIAIIIPTRQRPSDFSLFAESWSLYTESLSDVYVQTDLDDVSTDEIIKKYGFHHHKDNKKPFLYIINDMALRVYDKYKYVMFMEDDCVFTEKWESVFISILEKLEKEMYYGIVWCNDNINRESIVGLPCMTSTIIKALGYITPPEIKCLWADHFWKDLGNEISCLHYIKDLTIEHRHYTTGKREKCNISEAVDNIGHTDYASYLYYKSFRFKEDVEKCLDFKNKNK